MISTGSFFLFIFSLLHLFYFFLFILSYPFYSFAIFSFNKKKNLLIFIKKQKRFFQEEGIIFGRRGDQQKPTTSDGIFLYKIVRFFFFDILCHSLALLFLLLPFTLFSYSINILKSFLLLLSLFK